MARFDLKVYSKDTNNNQVTNTISYIKGGLSEAAYASISGALVDMTQDTYVGAELIATYVIGEDTLPNSNRAMRTAEVEEEPIKKTVSTSPFTRR